MGGFKMDCRAHSPLNMVLCALMTALLSFNCTQNVAGGGTDYPNTKTLAGTVNNSAGSPVSGAQVRLVDNALWIDDVMNGDPVVIDSAKTDVQGKFSVHLPREKSWNMQIDGINEGILIRDFGDGLDTTADITRSFDLRPYAAVSGTMQADSGTPKTLRFHGSAYAAIVNADHSYSAGSLAAGEYSVITEADVNGTLRPALGTSMLMNAGSTTAGLAVVAPVNRVLVDDFSIGRDQTDLGRLIGAGWWYAVDDNSEGGNSTVSYGVFSGAEAFSGQSMRITYSMGTVTFDPWLIAGFFIGRSQTLNTYDYSKLQSLSFEVKGTGNIEIRFYSKILDTLSGSDGDQFSYTMPIPATWTHFTLPVDSLALPKSSVAYQMGYTWSQVAKSLYVIAFVAKYPDNNPGDIVTLNIDDIFLDGMDLNAFVR
jgi:hypothetical protein